MTKPRTSGMSAALLRLLAGVLSAVSLDRRPRVVSEHPDALGYRMTQGEQSWTVARHYRLGDRATWCGVDLVCTRDHYVGDAALYPWDPGSGWAPELAATLWTPNGPDAARSLSALLADRTTSGGMVDRVYRVLDEAIGR